MSTFYVYIVTNKPYGTLYTGMTSELSKRIEQHKSGKGSRFTSQYECTELVYCERCGDVEQARHREHQIKAGSRQKKIDLIESINAEWKDMSKEWLV